MQQRKAKISKRDLGSVNIAMTYFGCNDDTGFFLMSNENLVHLLIVLPESSLFFAMWLLVAIILVYCCNLCLWVIFMIDYTWTLVDVRWCLSCIFDTVPSIQQCIFCLVGLVVLPGLHLGSFNCGTVIFISFIILLRTTSQTMLFTIGFN